MAFVLTDCASHNGGVSRLGRVAVFGVVALLALTPLVPLGAQTEPTTLEEMVRSADPSEAAALHVKLVEPPQAMDTADLTAALEEAGATAEPLFDQAGPDDELSKWVRVELGDPAALTELFETLNELDTVQVALPEPVLAPASFVQPPSATPSYEPNQLYLGVAPGGIDANYAWTVAGGTGTNVNIFDIEYSWNVDHEDLTGAVGAELLNGSPTDPLANPDHGTAVAGIIGADDNGFGVTGIAPDARLSLVNVYNGSGAALAEALNLATANAASGDIILIEQQLCPEPLVGSVCAPGWLPVEWFPSYYDAIVAAVAQGITVVEPAGNSGRDIDAQLVQPDSGAIVVGAANPSSACAAFGGGPAGSRLSFSNYGSRVDLAASGACVWTTGSQGGAVNPTAGQNQLYTDSFSGTSSAAAIVAGAAASLSSVAIEAGEPLAPAALRALLRSTGTPQDTTLDQLPIGPIPDLRRAIDEHLAPAQPAPPSGDEDDDAQDDTRPACDLNADGYGDLLIGVPAETINGQRAAGAVNVLYGHAAGKADTAPIISQATSGVAGAAKAGDNFGAALACGDIDGDGYDDAVVGVPGDTRAQQRRSGAIQVLYGSPTGIDGARDQLVSQASGSVPGRVEAGDRFGAAVAVGDLNGDGYDDVVVGVPGERLRGRANAGLVAVLYGGTEGLRLDGAVSIHQAKPGVPGRPEAGDSFGASLAVGDTNGDGYDDVYIGVPGEGLGGSQRDGGVVAIVAGPNGVDTRTAKWLPPNRLGAGYGSALALGDLNGDLHPELAVGSDQAVDVLRGSPDGVGRTRAAVVRSGRRGVAGSEERGDRFGSALKLIGLRLYVGASGEDLAGVADTGAVIEVEFGPDFALVASRQISQRSPSMVGKAERGDRFGAALAADDLDGDGYVDLVVSAPGEKLSGINEAGMIIVIPGRSAGLDLSRDRAVHQNSIGVGGATETADGFGASLS